MVADRRMIFLLRLGQFIASSREPKDFWRQLLRGLELDHPDLPYALLYSAGNDVNETLSESSALSHHSNWVLEGSVRVPDAEKTVPKHINSEYPMDEFLPSFSELVKSDSPTLLHREDGTIPAPLIAALQGMLAWDTVVFLPIRATTDNVLGFLIIGLNARRKYDDDYRLFIQLLSRQLATSMAAAVLVEDEIQRGRMAAEHAYQDRNRLSRKLEIQAHEASEIESRFRRMADLAPVGMFHIDVDGRMVYANEVYYNLTEYPRNLTTPMVCYWLFLYLYSRLSVLIHTRLDLFQTMVQYPEPAVCEVFITRSPSSNFRRNARSSINVGRSLDGCPSGSGILILHLCDLDTLLFHVQTILGRLVRIERFVIWLAFHSSSASTHLQHPLLFFLFFLTNLNLLTSLL